MAFWDFASSADVVGNFHHNLKFTEIPKGKMEIRRTKAVKQGSMSEGAPTTN